ncbi:MAG: serine/threonine protein kinase [Balneolaceae bacterium]|nr:MAG: serine/threonine protein kinase [Balneolaceae bacterium]
MSSDSNRYWKLLSDLYEEAYKLTPAEQVLFADENCEDPAMKEELLSMLDVHDSSSNFFNSLTASVIRPAFEELSDLPPISGTVNNYRLIKKIGRGGMGSVYLAERSDDAFQSQAAVKILRRGLDTDDILQRFDSERQILAQLNHPNITHLIDGGVTCDGRPYFIMEYVEGKPIDMFCDEHKLTIEERLHLFFQICKALSYAHQNLVIHRDLKPGNIYVTNDGFVKLLDFGIAKLLDDNLHHARTLDNSGFRLMTPDFASPEQVSGKPMNTASDIYQLGLVLYRLLSGCKAYSFKNKTITQTEHVILNEQAIKPSYKLQKVETARLNEISVKRSTSPKKLIQSLKGDLDTIITNALQKDSSQRYQSVVEFKEDIERHLKGLPIRARKQNYTYRSVKFLKRNQLPVATVTIFVAMLISFFIFYNITITEQRNEAQSEALKAAQITSFLVDLFEANDPTQSQGENLTAWRLLQQGEERIKLLEGQPDVQAQMFEVTGQIYRKLGQFERSEELLSNALYIRKDLFGEDHAETISVYNELGLLYSDLGNFEKADSLLRSSLALQAAKYTPDLSKLAETQFNLAYILRRIGNYDEAEVLYRESLEVRNRIYGLKHESTVASMSSLGVTLLNKGLYSESEHIFREVLELRKELLGTIHPDLAMSMNNLGATLLTIGKFKEAEQLFSESLEMRKLLLGDMHPKVALTMNNLGIALMEQGQYDEAYENISTAHNVRSSVLGVDNVNTAISKFTLGEIYLHTGRIDHAHSILKDAYDVFYNRLSESHSFTARTKMALGLSILHKGDSDRAEDFIRTGFAHLQNIHSERSLEKALGLREFAIFKQKTGHYIEAFDLFNEALTVLRDFEGPHSERQDRIMRLLNELPV